eukprot:1336076-Rhodomonas_salina.1
MVWSVDGVVRSAAGAQSIAAAEAACSACSSKLLSVAFRCFPLPAPTAPPKHSHPITPPPLASQSMSLSS